MPAQDAPPPPAPAHGGGSSCWGSDHERVLTEWKNRSFVQAFLQLHSFYAESKFYNILSIPTILLSTVAGASMFSSNAAPVQYAAAAMTLSSAVLAGLMRQLQPGERAAQHLAHAKRWSALIRTVEKCLGMPVAERPPTDIFVAQVQTEMDAIEGSQPAPTGSAMKHFRSLYGSYTFQKMVLGKELDEAIREAGAAGGKRGIFPFRRSRSQTMAVDTRIEV